MNGDPDAAGDAQLASAASGPEVVAGATEATVVYDVRVTEVHSTAVTMGLVAIAIGAALWLAGRMHADAKVGSKLRALARLSFLASVPWTVLATLLTFVPERVYRTMMTEDRAPMVEGLVEQMKPAVPDGRKRESFVVSGIEFDYVDIDEGAGFHTYVMNGNPLRNGDHVRIFYSGNTILRIERLR